MRAPGHLAFVDPTRPRGALSRAYARFAGSKAGTWLSERISWKLDPVLLRLSGGRVSTAWPIRVALLDTTGARTGRQRSHAVIYFHDGDAVVVVASYRGEPRHPAWFHNLVANPVVQLNGRPHRATVVRDEVQLQRLWALADNVFAPYATYRRRAAAASGRVIPIVRLDPQ